MIDTTPGDLTYPMNVKQYSHIRITAKTYSLPDADVPGDQNKQSKTIRNCYFYIPTGLVQGVNSSWSVEDPSVLVQNFESGNFWESLSTSAAQMGLKLGEDFAAGSIKNLKSNLGAKKGLTMKPTSVLVLDEVGRYSMSLNFDLAPQTPDEGKMVLKIIKYFREWSQPTLDTSGDKIWMAYPPIFDIFVNPQKSSQGGVSSKNLHTELFHYTNMVLEGYSATHGGGANEALFYKDGTPIQTSLNLTFKSLRPGWNNI